MRLNEDAHFQVVCPGKNAQKLARGTDKQSKPTPTTARECVRVCRGMQGENENKTGGINEDRNRNLNFKPEQAVIEKSKKSPKNGNARS